MGEPPRGSKQKTYYVRIGLARTLAMVAARADKCESELVNEIFAAFLERTLTAGEQVAFGYKQGAEGERQANPTKRAGKVDGS